MKLNIKSLLPLTIFLVVFLFLFSLFTYGVQAGPKDTNYGLDDTVGVGSVGSALSVAKVNSNPQTFLSTRIGEIVGAALSFIGVIFLALIVYAGFRWMLSAGNQQAVDKAKELLVAAIIGLVIVLAAYAITAFIGRQLTDSSPSASVNAGTTQTSQ
jgi:cbb3-type cytochrome oxidase subunit 3